MVDFHCGMRLCDGEWPDGDHFRRTLSVGVKVKGFINSLLDARRS
jgi:hypothetical protein